MSLRDFAKLSHKNENSMRTDKLHPGEKPSKKRMATSPAKGDIVKRSAFGDITNAMTMSKNVPSGKEALVTKKPTKKLKIATRKSQRTNKQDAGQKVVETKQQAELSITKKIANVTLSQPSSQKSASDKSMTLDFVNEESSEYVDAFDSFMCSQSPTAYYQHELSQRRKDLFFDDLDAENADNPSEAPVYALVIFEYMRAREKQFPIVPYMPNQAEVTVEMRSILVDWMVEVQENFELNHETLYLAVKLVDLYLQCKKVSRDSLQLIGATSLLIAAKFDERHPPYIDDFLYICDDAYNRRELLAMERSILYAVGFDINIPISYRFLRRYAKCSKTNMQTLTLARFALELSLQHYEFVGVSDSLLAGAALWLAFKMMDNGKWTDTLEYYSSHQESDLLELATKLNAVIIDSKGKKLQTVWQKYSHAIFYEVAKTPALTDDKIIEEKERITKGHKVMEQVTDPVLDPDSTDVLDV